MAVVAAIVMAANPVSNPVVCCLPSGDDGCDGTDNGTCREQHVLSNYRCTKLLEACHKVDHIIKTPNTVLT